jgi:hypothetical protein
LYRKGSLISFEVTIKYKFDLVEVQEVRWEGSGTKSAGDYAFFYGKANETHELGAHFVHMSS